MVLTRVVHVHIDRLLDHHDIDCIPLLQLYNYDSSHNDFWNVFHQSLVFLYGHFPILHLTLQSFMPPSIFQTTNNNIEIPTPSLCFCNIIKKDQIDSCDRMKHGLNFSFHLTNINTILTLQISILFLIQKILHHHK
jgi:hypothetical protein